MEQTISPDTHAFVKEMTAAGMSEPVAEAFVTNYTKHLIGNLATKQDMTTLMLETKLGLIRWVVGTGATFFGLAVVALKLFP